MSSSKEKDQNGNIGNLMIIRVEQLFMVNNDIKPIGKNIAWLLRSYIILVIFRNNACFEKSKKVSNFKIII